MQLQDFKFSQRTKKSTRVSPSASRPPGRRARKACAISAQTCLRQGGRTGLPQQAALNSPEKSGRVPDFSTSARVPAPWRRGLVRCTPGHLLLPFQGNSPCADERGLSLVVSPEPQAYPRGTASPLEISKKKSLPKQRFFLAFYLVARRRALASMRSRVTSSSTAPMITRPRTRF